MIIAQFVFSSARSGIRSADASIYPQEAKIAGGAQSPLDEAGKWKCTRGIRCAQAEISFEGKFFAAAPVEAPMSAAVN
jgi:hypothetical protein